MPQRSWAYLVNQKWGSARGGRVYERGGRENKDGGVTMVKTNEGEKVTR